MQLIEIINLIENSAPPGIAAPWDKSGIQVAARRKEISHMAVMLDPTAKSVRQALDLGADFLLSHHPLSMQPRFPDTLGHYHTVLSMLFSNDVCLYSAHTSLDASPSRPARWLAEAFGLLDLQVLEPTGMMPASSKNAGMPAGLGFVGNLPAPLDYSVFCRKFAEIAETGQWRTCGPKPSRIKRLACCPGSGADLIGDAAKAGADLYITGDLKYHAALDAELHVLDPGHFLIEETMMRIFAEELAAAMPKLKVSFIRAGDPLIFANVM